MGILRCDHPDIVDFIEAKRQKGMFENFNLSVAVTDQFMDDVRADRFFELKNPATGKTTGKLKAAWLFDRIVNAAWCSGDPGLFFVDEVNRKNPTPQIGTIEATNPCGELPLLAFESCNLASINLAKMVEDGRLEWDKLKDRVNWGIRFLDNMIDVNNYPLPQIEAITRANRKIGLGVMGFADMLILLGIPYTSEEAFTLAGKLMRFINNQSFNASFKLAEQRGVFPNFEKSVYAGQSMRLRNATVNTIAPTGTISIIAGCSSGIEPLFAVSFVRHVLSGTKLFEVNPVFERMAQEQGLYKEEILDEMARTGSLQTIREMAPELKRLFVTAFDVPPLQHVKIQAAFQKYTDNAVSKTINLPENASVEDVRAIYLKAHELNCKGITIYRYNSKDRQVLSFGSGRTDGDEPPQEFVTVESDYTGGCIGASCPF
jgi:ribonucleoside-diphosphate reductase alpha chain